MASSIDEVATVDNIMRWPLVRAARATASGPEYVTEDVAENVAERVAGPARDIGPLLQAIQTAAGVARVNAGNRP